MKVIAINGSPRKKWNTAKLLEMALKGAASQGAETEIVHLYDLTFKGCTSCFSCKTKGGKHYGKCGYLDELTPVLKRIETVDALILGSPIYLGITTGEMRSFMERLIFPYLAYTDPLQSLFPKKIKTGFIYTMNVTSDEMHERGYDWHFNLNETYLRTIFGAADSLFCFDTYQFKDYSKMAAERFDASKKTKRHKEIFPEDCNKAYEMGVRNAHPFE
jgi:multimeric flavodoxin WrbA